MGVWATTARVMATAKATMARRNDSKGNDGKGNDGKGNDSKGNDGKGNDGKGNDGKGNDGKGNCQSGLVTRAAKPDVVVTATAAAPGSVGTVSPGNAGASNGHQSHSHPRRLRPTLPAARISSSLPLRSGQAGEAF